MAKQISELTNKAVPAGTDEIPIQETGGSTTKKATLANVFASPPALGGTTPAAVNGTTGTFSGVVSVDDDTDSTSGTTGSVHTDGGLGVAKSLFVGQNAIITGFLNIGSASELTISSGAVTATKTFHTIDTEGDASTDDLDTINGGVAGHILVLRPASDARTVVLKDGTGNLALAGDFSMDISSDYIVLIYETNWTELTRSDNAT